MGFLEIGAPLTWEENTVLRDQIKRDGLTQLLHIFNINRAREDTDLKWGEEIEFTLVHLDHENKKASICVDGPQILEKLECMESRNLWEEQTTLGEAASILSGARSPFLRGTVWHPEFGRHMIEATPNPPYEMDLNSLLDVEDSMLSRRYKLQSVLPPDVYATSLTAFPRLGCEGFLYSENHEDIARIQDVKIADMSCGKSNFIPDLMICPHPRFPTLVRNICHRRGVKTTQLIPVFKDDHTATSPAWDKSLPLVDGKTPNRHVVTKQSDVTANPVKDHIYLDHFGFGMGMSCLQMTYGTPNLATARFLYDQMAVLAPIFLALSAATPMLRGWLSDLDARWKVLEQGCDCRTDEEVEMYKRTRYGPVSLYISDDEYAKKYSAELNDVEVPLYEPGLAQLVAGGMDETLARHFASLWIRDPLVIFGDRVNLDNSTRVDHFENIQSTNWNSVRFKPPPGSVDGKTRPSIGWRVELRTPDLQLSDFENAMLASISQVLALAIMKEGWRFYVPISATHANMETAHKRNAVRKGLFYFNSKVTSCFDTNDDGGNPADTTTRMTLREIFMGSSRTGFQGLIPMMDEFVSEEWRSQRCSRDAVEKYRIYANYLRMRVLGQAPSDAQVLRQFVLSHPLYQGDSQITPALNYDICKYAVLSGFSLRPTETCWSCVPGCMSFASATRQVSLTAPLLSSWSNVPALQNLLALPVDEGRQSLRDVLAANKQTQPKSEDGDSQRSTLASPSNKTCSCGDSLRKTGGSSSCCHHGFDPELYLRMDQFSR